MSTVISPAPAKGGIDVLLEDFVGAYKTLCGKIPTEDQIQFYAALARQHNWSHYSLLLHILITREAQLRLQTPAIAKSGVMMDVKLHNGMTIFGPITDLFVTYTIKKNTFWEKKEEAIMNNLVRAGDTVIDIGANIGYFTAILSGIVGDKGKVWSVEMAPMLVNCLRKTLEFNKLKNVEIILFALADHEEKMVITYNYVNFGGSCVFPKAPGAVIDPTWEEEVQTRRLDDLLPAEEKVDFIKMDIEGSEGLAFLGMEKLLRRCRPDLLFEYTPAALISRSTPPEKVLGGLEALGYRFGYVKDLCEKENVRQELQQKGKSAQMILEETKNLLGFENLVAVARD